LGKGMIVEKDKKYYIFSRSVLRVLALGNLGLGKEVEKEDIKRTELLFE